MRKLVVVLVVACGPLAEGEEPETWTVDGPVTPPDCDAVSMSDHGDLAGSEGCPRVNQARVD